MKEEIQNMVDLGEQANALARSASIESARLHEGQKRLAGIAAGMSVLADEAAAAAAGFHDKLVVVESDLRPPAQMVVLMTGILKHIKELSETVEQTIQSQTVATKGLAVSVGEAVGGGTRITSQIVSLAEAIQTIMPMVGNKNKVEAELASLTAELNHIVTNLQRRRGNMGTAVPDGKPPSIN